MCPPPLSKSICCALPAGGPDDQRVVQGPFGLMGFGRLAIMGLTPDGMQPFRRGADCVVCNGELYGFRFEKEILQRAGYKFRSGSDCEILLPLYYEYGLDMFRHLDAEFALILYDSRKDRLIAARDPIGIRPLFYGYSKTSHQIAFASELQNLVGWCEDIRPFPIGSYYCDGRFVRYEDVADVPAPHADGMEQVLENIRTKLIAGVEKAAGRRRAGGLSAVGRAGQQPGVRHRCPQAGAHPHLCHRDGHRRHRPEIRPADGGVPGQRTPMR